MKMTKVIISFSFPFLYLLLLLSPCVRANPLVPALYVFGDSLLDSGNNNFLPTMAKANFFPYGSNFAGETATGRFTNGRTVADFIAEFLGLPYSPPFMSIEGPRSVTGVNYASGSCGILPETGKFFGKCLNLKEQIDLFERTVSRELPNNLENPTLLFEHLSKSIYLVSIGSNDYINNYLQTNLYDTSERYQPDPYAQLLIDTLSQLLERLYKLGARKIVIFEVGPVGCIPSVSKTHPHKGFCNEESNQFVSYFNKRLATMAKDLTSRLRSSTFVIGHTNSGGYDVINNPTKHGLTDGSNPCCTTWKNETSACIPDLEPCKDPNKHVFWDAFHLTETVYSIVASRCVRDKTMCTPMSIQELVKM
ncbi:GDSL esterase/lipase 7-like [Lotus japonicus]|uniref:GDSL esterase/lipase 7-like n=1 Tax=Lotus japonicus TaxID=34305 RepID=UPI00258B14EE|nr:GDSL esterase/lipase 7-like [Lotus japonicus]XP_057447773.1 GDSL esterase/lipase 7-like [Lotus japonicus]